jgi:Rhodopirellula transposase DDE domain
MRNKNAELLAIEKKYDAVWYCLNERGRRLWAAAEAESYGRGGIVLVCQATGLSKATLHKGLKELRDPTPPPNRRLRKAGGGRKKITEKNKDILNVLDSLVDPTARGDPESHLKWTSKSVRNLSKELSNKGFQVSFRTIASLLKELDYSLQSNKKTKEGRSHEDRDAQFQYINKSVTELQSRGQPTISVDTKKKENIGEFKNNGREYSKKGKPVEVDSHDFPDKKLGKVVPYGIYDIGKNNGWISVGISSDTAEFAVNAIRTWWYKMGKEAYSTPVTDLLITADCGGSNGYRVRLWKLELQKFSNESRLKIHVRHFPPGTSKWNKIEHKLFSYISKNWRGRPLISRETVVNLIGNTKTQTGLRVMAVLDENEYEKGKEVTDEEMTALNIKGESFHPEWNYTIAPQIV